MVQIYIEHKEITLVLKICPVLYTIYIPIFWSWRYLFQGHHQCVSNIEFPDCKAKTKSSGRRSFLRDHLFEGCLTFKRHGSLCSESIRLRPPKNPGPEIFSPAKSEKNLHLKVRVQVSGTKEKDLKKKIQYQPSTVTSSVFMKNSRSMDSNGFLKKYPLFLVLVMKFSLLSYC